MTDDNRAKRSKKRNESGLHGKHYERKILSLIALKCLLNEDIKDFWLYSNPKDLDKFDDVILFTEEWNEKKKIFMIQIKHKLQGQNRPIVADKLDGNDKNLSLKIYEEAFFKIKQDKDFLEKNKIPVETEMFFILFNNCTVNQDVENENIYFKNDTENVFSFINTSLKENGMLRIVNKCAKYDQDFLNHFYFYTEQLNEDSVEQEICNLLDIDEETVQRILSFFYRWVEDSDCTQLNRLDINLMLLDIYLCDPLPRSVEDIDESILLNILNDFDVTVITQEFSSVTIWTEILHEIQHFYSKINMQSIPWEETVPEHVKEKLSLEFENINTLFIDGKIPTIKRLYLFMVTQQTVPFFISTNNKMFNSFKDKLLLALDISSVVFKAKNDDPIFPDGLQVFEHVSDIKQELYVSSKPLSIFFQDKSGIDLYAVDEIRQKMSADNYIEFLYKNYIIGDSNKLPDYYINRQLKIPVLRSDVFGENELTFIIFEYPTKRKKETYIDLANYLSFYEEIHGKSDVVVTINDKYNNNLAEEIKKFENRSHCFLKYIKQDTFLFMYTNAPIELLKPHLHYICIKDTELVNICKSCNTNIICNNAGMGKSMLLSFINSKLAVAEWVIHIDLKKHAETVKCIKTVKELITFSFQCQNQNISKNKFLETIYKCLKSKVIWLIDDYEEMNQPGLINLLIEANKQGIRMWIVARPFLKSEFEHSFGVFSMELIEFDKNDQTQFIQKYLKHNKKTRLDIEKTMMAIENVRNLLEDSFIGICQQTMMLAEIFSDYKDDWKEHEWHIDNIYEEFVKLKISDSHGVEKKWYSRTLSKLALKVFFKDTALKKVFDLEEFDEDVNIFKDKYKKDFFVTEFGKRDVPIFSHKTYAEFLAARWLLHTVEKQMNNETPFNTSNILQMLYLKELTSVRVFFDNMVTRELPLHSAIINQEKDKIAELINEPKHFSTTDSLGRSILHLVSSYGTYFDIGMTTNANKLIRNMEMHSQIVRQGNDILLQPIESEKSDKSNANITKYMNYFSFIDGTKTISKRDSLLKLHSTDYALLSGSLLELDKLFAYHIIISKYHTNIEYLRNITSSLKLTEEMTFCLLFHCIQNRLEHILHTLNVKGLNNLKIGHSKMSLLHLAVTSENLDAVKKLTEEHSLNDWGVDEDGNTPFHIACNKKNNGLLQYFYDLKDLDVEFLNKKNLKGESHLHFLARRGLKGWIELIISKFPKIIIDPVCCAGNTPFILSIIYNQVKIATILKSNGANVNHINKKNMSAMHYATSKGFNKCVKQLLSWNVNINQKDNYGKTPLMKACSWGHKLIVTLLLSKKVKMNASDRHKRTALHYAVRRNHVEVVDLLLKYKASVNCVNDKKESPLIMACKYNYPKIVKLLLSCDITYGKKQALKISVKKKHSECIDLLLQTDWTSLKQVPHVPLPSSVIKPLLLKPFSKAKLPALVHKKRRNKNVLRNNNMHIRGWPKASNFCKDR